jgi:ribosomal protein S18 acetylase RimI-like enzyme
MVLYVFMFIKVKEYDRLCDGNGGLQESHNLSSIADNITTSGSLFVYSADFVYLQSLDNDPLSSSVAALKASTLGSLNRHRGSDSIYICSIAVLPNQRRKGHGQRLLESSINRLATLGFTNFSLLAHPISQELCQKVGFSLVNSIMVGEEEDYQEMYLDL